jgi:hypothetical protein
MLRIKEQIEWSEANAMLHSVAAVLTDEARANFYDHMQYSRNQDDPKKVVESVVANLCLLLCEEVKARHEKTTASTEEV